MIDRSKFFASSRANPFGGTLTQGQTDGMNIIIDAWDRSAMTDLRWLAYILATAKWETAHTMQPIEEYGKGAGHTYGQPDPITGKAYYGRGYVQITWKNNYQKMGAILGVDLVNHPELALEPDVACEIMFEGMSRGTFTGLSLNHYFNTRASNWIEARRIVNGTDRAEEIAEIAKAFHVAVGGIVSQPMPEPPQDEPRAMAEGMVGDDVAALHAALDRWFSPQTHERVVAFQLAHDLVPDGIVGKITRKALGI